MKNARRGVGSRFVHKSKRFARYIGLHKRSRTMPDGVRYRERSGNSLRRALSEHGSGVKEFDVRFPWIDSEGRRGMRIRYTTSRLYGELGHDPRCVLYDPVCEMIRPGMRVLEIGCGTGSGSAMLAGAVGPSGGVIAIDRDGESIRFARQRHRSDYCGFELGWFETLDGEIDDGFDMVVGVQTMRGAGDAPARARSIGEMCRVVVAGGFLVLIDSSREDLELVADGVNCLGFEFVRVISPCKRSGWSGVVYRRPGGDGGIDLQPYRDRPSPGSFHS